MLAFISNCIYLLLVYIQTFVFCKLTLYLAIFLKSLLCCRSLLLMAFLCGFHIDNQVKVIM